MIFLVPFLPFELHLKTYHNTIIQTLTWRSSQLECLLSALGLAIVIQIISHQATAYAQRAPQPIATGRVKHGKMYRGLVSPNQP